LKQTMFVLLIVVALSLTATALVPAATTSFTVDPLGPFVGVFGAQYEKALNGNSSITIEANSFSWLLDNWKLNGLGGEIGYRRYLNDTFPDGAFLGGSGGAGWFKAVCREYDFWTGTWDTFEGGGVVLTGTLYGGNKWVTNSGFTIEGVGGLAFSAGTVTAAGVTESTLLPGISPYFDIGVGYSW
jgi:hypothetical protein